MSQFSQRMHVHRVKLYTMADNPNGRNSQSGPSRRSAGEFGAGGALLVLLAWLGGQLAGGFLGAMSGMLYLGSLGLDLAESANIEQHMSELLTPALAVGTIVGAVAMIAATLSIAKGRLREVSATGIGWSRGSWRAVLLAATFGIVISALFITTIAVTTPDLAEEDLGPIARLAEQDERVRWIWAFIAVAIAPATEELLFRGVLFSGLARSWGVAASAVTVSILFVLFHLAETMGYWPSTVAIAVLTAGTIVARMMTNRLGPPIAMHFAYNSILALALVVGL